MKNRFRKFMITRGLYPKHWLRSFRSGEYHYYNGLRATFKKALPYLTEGRALDIGAGFGNETSVLLKNGYEVVATDVNLEAIKYLKKVAKTKNLQVFQQSLPELPEGKFDVIICEMVLHFLNASDTRSAIANMQQATDRGGLNIISTYIDSQSIHKDPRLKGYFKFLLPPGELESLYSDWEVLFAGEKVNAMGHPSLRFIARKK
ncbi:MAG TPA: methyltransferase domain-containing protein [Candidatus Saccharibacteria bacterium]|nr:tellurite methyltransferase [Patescibacteria group bacterium]HMS30957.1 methyltransferase domain-containing protein [Candidatus Saccharibacteria bacterium]